MSLSATNVIDARRSGVYKIGGDLPVHRLGFGTIRLTGEGFWGDPSDRTEAISVLRRAVELGVTFIDTADAYGPHSSEELIKDALAPYSEDLVIATKGGYLRTGPSDETGWHRFGRPEYLRYCVEMSLRRLGCEQIGLFQLHRIDPSVPLADQLGALAELKKEGKIRHIGLSEVDLDELTAAQKITPIASVQNKYNVLDRKWEEVLDYCERDSIAFIPWLPAAGADFAAAQEFRRLASEWEIPPVQLALAWLLRRSPVMLPIPGTSQVVHLEENIAAANVDLSDDQYSLLDGLSQRPSAE